MIWYNLTMNPLDFGNGVNTFYLISQFFALIATICSLIAVQKRRKVQLLNYNTLSSLCAIFHYAFLGAWSGMVTKSIATIRNGIATYEASKKRTSKLIPVLFVVFYIISGIASFSSWYSLLPTVAASIYTIAIYRVDVSKIRKYALLGSSLWLLYDICVFSVVGIISESIFIVDDLTAIYRFRKKKKSKKG